MIMKNIVKSYVRNVKFRKLEVERSRDQPHRHYPDRAIRSSKGFQAGEGR